MNTLSLITEEFAQYYEHFDPQTETLLARLDGVYQAHSAESVYQLRSRITQTLCEECEIHLFRHSPFFFEMSTGRPRYSWGGLQSPVGSYLHYKNADLWLNLYQQETNEDFENGFIHCWNNPVGMDHFCIGYDAILSEGILGMIQRAKAVLDNTEEKEQQLFLQSSIDSCYSLLHLANRFADQAQMLSQKATDQEEKEHYLKIARAASHVPAHPARSFYEALCSILFCRECIGSLEGIGVSVLGHLDRLLYPYYKADIAAGRITPEEALLLLQTLILYTEVRFDTHNGFHETSTTIILGGCDSDGQIIYNEVTRLMLDAVQDVHCINNKINCRVSSRHPREYLEKLAEIQSQNIAVLVLQNDDVVIPAFVKRGHSLEDSRLYVSGGCHEIVLANTAVSTRADTWISLPRLVLAAVEKTEQAPASSFDAFYQIFLTEFQNYIKQTEDRKNKYERLWSTYAPMPLCSATITGCIESGRDLTAGGARYSTTALSLLGTATFIDSLYSIKHLIYDTGMLTWEHLRKMLAENYANDEPIRQYILHKIPKFGTNREEINQFSASVLKDISKHAVSGQKNGRGGDYLPAFYPHDFFLRMGQRCGATPDGRPANTTLSRGCSPSEFIESKTPLDIINSIGAIDFTDFAESFCTEITLQRMEPDTGKNVLTAIMEAFLEQKGSSLQFNLLNREMLLEAQKHPEQHADIHVRVCGYSALFVHLAKSNQDEIISRQIR